MSAGRSRPATAGALQRRGVAARILLALSLVVLAGCATVTFKRGASPGAMASDEGACRAASTDDAGFVDCMRKRGWFVTGGGTSSPRIDTPVTQPNAVGRTPGAGAAASEEPAKRSPVGAPPKTVAPDTAARSAAEPPTTAAPNGAAAGDAPAAAAAADAAPVSAADPLARMEVGSWWKFGGSAADLDRAIGRCVEELGPSHRPAAGATVVTAGLHSCLRAAGWYGVGGSTSR